MVIVLNKVSPEHAEELRGKEKRAEFMKPIQTMLTGISYPELNLSKAVMVIANRPEWEDAQNVVMEFSPAVRNQLSESPSIRVNRLVLKDAMKSTAKRAGPVGGLLFRLKQAINSILP